MARGGRGGEGGWERKGLGKRRGRPTRDAARAGGSRAGERGEGEEFGSFCFFFFKNHLPPS